MFIRRIWKEAFALEDLVSLGQSQSSQRDQSTERGQERPLRISVEPLAAVVTSPSFTTTVTVEVNTPQTEDIPPPVPSSRPPDEEEWEPLPGDLDASEDEITEREGGKLEQESERVDTTFKPLVTFKDDGDPGKEKDTKKARKKTKQRLEDGEGGEFDMVDLLQVIAASPQSLVKMVESELFGRLGSSSLRAPPSAVRVGLFLSVNQNKKDFQKLSFVDGDPGFSGFPEAINSGRIDLCRRDRYQSTQLAETKRLTYHTPGSELRHVICDLPKSWIFRISGSHKFRQNRSLSARPVPIDSAGRDEAIDVSHARIRAATVYLPFYVTHVSHVTHVSREPRINLTPDSRSAGSIYYIEGFHQKWLKG
ncbi:hypothetical protein DdX_14876 [Ditylenchus destructor]|uniref:Uncharacterized protein n=1 Tax=Ditylenchus destructor TaxID=166010 RepID=A0AAD4R1I7_9BILA|nr:hypothetical protein DdX_14876 [Ditylenchus destructor]